MLYTTRKKKKDAVSKWVPKICAFPNAKLKNRTTVPNVISCTCSEYNERLNSMQPPHHYTNTPTHPHSN
jgi:hypothetical protein